MDLTTLANLLRSNELIVAALYRECAVLFPAFADDFVKLASEEEFHASLLTNVVAEISLNPQSWRAGKISIQTVNVLHEHLLQVLNELRSGKVDPRYGITMLRSFEQSMSERSVATMLIDISGNSDNNLQIIDDAFSSHSKRLQDLESKIFGRNEISEYFKF